LDAWELLLLLLSLLLLLLLLLLSLALLPSEQLLLLAELLEILGGFPDQLFGPDLARPDILDLLLREASGVLALCILLPQLMQLHLSNFLLLQSQSEPISGISDPLLRLRLVEARWKNEALEVDFCLDLGRELLERRRHGDRWSLAWLLVRSSLLRTARTRLLLLAASSALLGLLLLLLEDLGLLLEMLLLGSALLE
jgi:hypothetical protein